MIKNRILKKAISFALEFVLISSCCPNVFAASSSDVVGTGASAEGVLTSISISGNNTTQELNLTVGDIAISFITGSKDLLYSILEEDIKSTFEPTDFTGTINWSQLSGLSSGESKALTLTEALENDKVYYLFAWFSDASTADSKDGKDVDDLSTFCDGVAFVPFSVNADGNIVEVPKNVNGITGDITGLVTGLDSYKSGQALDLTGLTANISYDDGTSSGAISAADFASKNIVVGIADTDGITDGTVVEIASGAALTVADHNGKYIYVAYKPDGGTAYSSKIGELAVSAKALQSISLDESGWTKTFTEGSQLDLSGLTVSAIYDNGADPVTLSDSEWSVAADSEVPLNTNLTVASHNGKNVKISYTTPNGGTEIIGNETKTATTSSITVNDTPAYTVGLTETTAVAEKEYGDTPDAGVFTVTNTGNQANQVIKLELQGSDNDKFVLNKAETAALAAGGSETDIKVTPAENLNVGTYQVTLSAINKGNDSNTTAVGITFEVTQKALTWRGTPTDVTALDKVYDGSDSIKIETPVDITNTLDGIIASDNDKVILKIENGTYSNAFADVNAGDGKTVTISTGYAFDTSISGNKSGNYKLPDTGNPKITADIQKATISSVAAPTGSAMIGNTITIGAVTVNDSTATPAYTTDYTVEWFRSNADGSSEEQITGQTGESYQITAGDAGIVLYVKLSAAGSNFKTTGDAQITSAKTNAVSKIAITGEPTISITSDGGIIGAANVGDVLTVTKGTMNAELSDVDIQWYRGSTAITNATGAAYTIVSEDVAGDGEEISCELTAKADSQYTGSKKSGSMKAGKIAITGISPITGTEKYNETLSAGTVVPASATTLNTDYKLQWYRDTDNAGNDGVAIVGATGATYVLTQEDIGAYLYVKVTGIGDYTSSENSTYTGKIEKADGPAAPDAPTLGAIGYTSIEVKTLAGQEYAITTGAVAPTDADQWKGFAVDGTYTFNELNADTSYNVFTRIAETETTAASVASSAKTASTLAPAVPSAPVLSLVPGDGSITVNGSAEENGSPIEYYTVKITHIGPVDTTTDASIYKYNDGTTIQAITIVNTEIPNYIFTTGGATYITPGGLTGTVAYEVIGTPTTTTQAITVQGDIKDVDTTAAALGVTYPNLTNDTLHKVAVAAKNGVGSGPEAIETATPQSSGGGGGSHGGGGGGGGSSTTTGDHKVTFDAGGQGTLASGKAEMTVADGKKVSSVPTVTAKDGWTFKGWSTDGKTIVDPKTVEITKNTTFKAVYELKAGAGHHNYMSGYEDNTFRPDAGITRAEVATMFANISSDYSADSKYSTTLTDIGSGQWYDNYVAYGSEKGLITGYNDNSFKPNDKITRAEFVTIVDKYMKLENEGTSNYPDTNGHWAEGYIAQLSGKEIITGYEDNTFRPNADITRAEATRIMNGVFGRTPDKAKVDQNIGNYNVTMNDVPKKHWAYYEILEAVVEHVTSEFH